MINHTTESCKYVDVTHQRDLEHWGRKDTRFYYMTANPFIINFKKYLPQVTAN